MVLLGWIRVENGEVGIGLGRWIEFLLVRAEHIAGDANQTFAIFGLLIADKSTSEGRDSSEEHALIAICELEGFSREPFGQGLDAYGAPVFYRILQDDDKGRDLPSSAILHVFEPEWAGGVRSHPTIQHSINHVLDEMELLALEKHAVKDNADLSRILKTTRGELDDNGDFVVGGWRRCSKRCKRSCIPSTHRGCALEAFGSIRCQSLAIVAGNLVPHAGLAP